MANRIYSIAGTARNGGQGIHVVNLTFAGSNEDAARGWAQKYIQDQGLYATFLSVQDITDFVKKALK